MMDGTMAAFGLDMAPSHDESVAIQKRLADLDEQLQQAKRSAEQRFVALADASPAMIWRTGPDALHWYFNRAWLEFRGRALEEEVGNGWTEGLHPDDHDLCLETYLKAFSARQPFHMQYRMRGANGEFYWVENSGFPAHNEIQDFIGFI